MVIFSPEMLQQHIGVLGKTGSGKTSTSKLVVEYVYEHVVPLGARVCILDPLKSDWWGLTSSADGKKPGLPFTILGGPHGHVPLHDRAGKAVGELVANSSLPLSIIDMSEFGPGGHARFFVDFASTLFKKVKGIVYLVIEEAHIFAPKERTGGGEENMAIYWAKLLATASRTKGIRLIICSQRTQALHNAVLGSCETMVAHKFTAPADQKPVLDWLKANASPEIYKEIAPSLSSLKTGEGWICTGEHGAKRVQFPRIKTFDNTATPTERGQKAPVQVHSANLDQLREMLGEMITEAEASDPAKLRARIAELERQLAKGGGISEREVTARYEIGRRDGYQDGYNVGLEKGYGIGWWTHQKSLSRVMADLPNDPPPLNDEDHEGPTPRHRKPAKNTLIPAHETSKAIAKAIADANPSGVSPSARAILDQIHNAYPTWITFDAAARRAGISKKSSAYRKYIKEVVTSGEIEGEKSKLRSLPQYGKGGSFDPNATIAAWVNRLPPTPAKILAALSEYNELSKGAIADVAEISPTSSGLGSGLRQLMDLELVVRVPSTPADLYRLAEGFK